MEQDDVKLTPAQEAQKELLGDELTQQLAKEKAQEEIDARQRSADEAAAQAQAEKAKKKIVLKNTLGEVVDSKDYFYVTPKTAAKGKDTTPIYFHDVCGYPVEREDMVNIFNKIFKPKHNILFYKTLDKEVYVIIVPIKYSSIVGPEHNSVDGEFQKHAISFVSEGSVNLDMLKTKLTRVASTIKIEE